MIAEACRVSVPLNGVCYPGKAMWSRRCCIGPTFGEVLIFPTLCEHLVLVVTFRGAPRGVGVPSRFGPPLGL